MSPRSFNALVQAALEGLGVATGAAGPRRGRSRCGPSCWLFPGVRSRHAVIMATNRMSEGTLSPSFLLARWRRQESGIGSLIRRHWRPLSTVRSPAPRGSSSSNVRFLLSCRCEGPLAVRKIIHIHMDAFYAAVEQRDAPDLRGRPVPVGRGAKRGVVAAASYEARAFGVRSAMPSTTAMAKCPGLIFVAPRFDIYRAVSRQIQAIFADYTAIIEPLSLDEAYLDVTVNQRGTATATATATEIRTRIFEETGLTASAGISYNKFLAKLASDHRKPNGQFLITPAMGPRFIETLPVGKFHGIGPVTAAKMNGLGIFTGADLRRQPPGFLQQYFSKSGMWYSAIAGGEDERPVVADRPRKSSGSETTFAEDLTDPAAAETGLEVMADDVWAWCEKANAFGHTVTVKIKFADFRQATRSRTLNAPVASRSLLVETSVALLRSVYPLRIGIRLVGVTVSNFREAVPNGQLDLALLSDNEPA
jgi:DNA polymerase IV